MYIEKDKLNRMNFVVNLKKIIDKKIEDNTGFSFAIDGTWGSGKTFIVNMLDEIVKDQYLVVKYNCWKYDYYEEPVVAIMSVIAETLNKIVAEENPPSFVNKATFKNLAEFLIGTTAELIKAATRIDISKIIELGKDVVSKEYKEAFSKDFDSKDTISKAIKIIQFALILANADRKVLFIVDELDRCLPEYAIKVLERLHHVNENTPFVTLLSINKKELAGSIAKVFGHEGESEPFTDYYLQKFINIIIPVPSNDPQPSLLDSFALSKNLFDLSKASSDDDFKNFIQSVLGCLNMRTVETIDKQIAAVFALMGPQVSATQQPSIPCFCYAVLMVAESFIFKKAISIDLSKLGKDVATCLSFSANGHRSDYIKCSEKLKQWSLTPCEPIIGFNGILNGYLIVYGNLQDYVKSMGFHANEKISSKLRIAPADFSFAKEFSRCCKLLSPVQ
ncbi:P-loop NTPase fold protein [Fibrobacter sp. UWB12]|uniref:KAP family P-loop NTPase fold protein n=1 Tax=Fibrobacter sp. UWB12 TaxID=1896203 RepID=UPI000915835C|nr:P-loop NTPase fold protein [Fibrobacter sp. UWB12]SHK41405.1 KAP family P-loop domain-containing protein [Fibrobacter sp. UWB12]